MYYNNQTMYCSAIEQTTDGIILIPNREVKNLINAQTYKLIICNNVSAEENLPVFIRTNVGDIPVLCKAGNTMYANQLDTRTRYPIIYGSMNENYVNGQFVILSRVSPRSVIAPVESI